ncbi:MAG: hypothetical protein ACRD3Q_11560 [Terriglobales bacterium]
MLRLDIRRLRRWQWVRPLAGVSGTICWSENGERSASIALAVDLMERDWGVARLNFSIDGQPRMQVIPIVSEPCRYGGRRFYFQCPRSGRRCEVLYCVGGVFASRQVQRLSYLSQSLDGWQRRQRTCSKIEARFNGIDGRGPPRGRNRARLLQRWERLEDEANELANERLAGLIWRLGLAKGWLGGVSEDQLHGVGAGRLGCRAQATSDGGSER